MSDLVTCRLDGPVATITMDDGKVNALSLGMLGELGTALDRAEADRAVVVLTGRPGRFSAGFDLGTLRGGGDDARQMVRDGFELAERLLSFPTPVVVACTGHTIAMALFLVLSADYRLGAAGQYQLTANEVAIGLPLPQAAIELCRQRVSPAAFTRVTMLAEVFPPDAAVDAGLLDRVVAPDDLAAAAHTAALGFADLDLAAHQATKLRARAETLTALRAAIEADNAALHGGTAS